MMYNFDPFTQVYTRLLKCITSQPLFSTYVRPGNVVDFTSPAPEPVKDEVEDSDLPEMQLIPVGGPITQLATNITMVDYAFEVQITTGDERVNVALMPLQWIIMRGIYSAGESLGFKWIKQVRMTAINSLNAGESQRGTEGWISVMKITVKILIDNDELEAGNESPVQSSN